MSRINIFTGHFGSGKTEISINYAIKLAEQGKKVVIVDLDVVNPFFCVRELKDKLEEKGIKVISSNPEYVNAELMVVPPEVLSVFHDKSYEVVIDIGGDNMGAMALGQYNKYIKAEPYEMFFVINTNRPFTQDSKTAEEYIQEIEYASRLKATKLISNTNLSYETEEEDIFKGDREVSALSERLGVPYAYTVCRRDFVDIIKGKVKGKEIFPIDIFMMPPWKAFMAD